MRFLDKVIIITGGSSGIGAATAQLLAKEGALVFVLDIQPPIFDNLNNIFFHQCDVSKVDEIKSAVESITAKQEKIDYLFTNAGVHFIGSIEETNTEDLNRLIDINFKGTFCVIKEVLPSMKHYHEGSIVVMGSDQVLIGKCGNAVYGTTKAAVAQLVKNVALDYSAFNIRINCVCPGTIDTPLTRNAIKHRANVTQMDPNDILKTLESKIPLGRIGKADEVAKVVAFLLSEDASYITGSAIMIDGGITAQ